MVSYESVMLVVPAEGSNINLQDWTVQWPAKQGGIQRLTEPQYQRSLITRKVSDRTPVTPCDM
jgi:hypothetical protein